MATDDPERASQAPTGVTRREALTAAASLALVAGCHPKEAPMVTPKTRPKTPAAAARRPARAPALYLPHGGGPCFFMDWTMGPADTWARMRGWLEQMGQSLEGVEAIAVVSAHWEAPNVTVQTKSKPGLLFDYSGFPPHTYQLTWPAPGAPDHAARALELLKAAGIASAADATRDFDHGVFVPLKVALPKAQIPTFQISLVRGLDPAAHLAIGRALAPLRDEGVMILGSGMSFHNMRAFMRPDALPASQTFDAWLSTATADPATRGAALTDWAQAPQARYCHPREEHLMPLMVVAGAAEGEAGETVFRDQVMGVAVSATAFGMPG